MSLEDLGAWMRRVAGWTWKALVAVLAFVVVYKVTRFLDGGRSSAGAPAGPIGTQVSLILREMSLLAGAALLFDWVKRHLPTHRPRYALLDFLTQSPVDSPEFTATALQHFRWRSQLLAAVAVTICLFALMGLAAAFGDVRSEIPVAMLGALCLFLYGAFKLKREMGRFRAVTGAASADEASRLAVVRSLALEDASSDEVSRAIWPRFEPEVPAPAPAAAAPA